MLEPLRWGLRFGLCVIEDRTCRLGLLRRFLLRVEGSLSRDHCYASLRVVAQRLSKLSEPMSMMSMSAAPQALICQSSYGERA